MSRDLRSRKITLKWASFPVTRMFYLREGSGAEFNSIPHMPGQLKSNLW